MKKVAIIGTVGILSRYGGFETLVHLLADELKGEFGLTVFCSKKAYQKNERLNYIKNVKGLIDIVENLNHNDLISKTNKMAQIAIKRYRWSFVANKYKNLVYAFDYNYIKQNIKANISLLSSSYLQKKKKAWLI